jgi:hypothetical protein
MNETEYDSNRLTGEQILMVLELTLESQVADEFQRLVASTSSELLRETHERLESNRLGLTPAARLLGVNELTLQGWFKSSKPLPEMAHQKLAGLCLVLSLADIGPESSEATGLARSALAAVVSGQSQTPARQAVDSTGIVEAAFDAVGLAAASLHSALMARSADSTSTGAQ